LFAQDEPFFDSRLMVFGVLITQILPFYKGLASCQTVALNPVHTSNNVEATLSNATKSNVASTLLLVWTGLYAYR